MQLSFHVFAGSSVLLLCCTIIVELAGSADYYRLLEVPRTAATHDIKKSFRKLAMKYHPDHNKDANAEATFRDIVSAYEILSDETKRKQYDRYGAGAFDGTGETRHGDPGGGFNRDDFFRHFDQSFRAYSGNNGNKGGFKFQFGQHQFDFDDLWGGFEGNEFSSFFAHGPPHGGGGGPFGFGAGGGPSMFGHMGDGLMHGFDHMAHAGAHYVGHMFGMGDAAADYYDQHFSPFAANGHFQRHSENLRASSSSSHSASSTGGQNCKTETKRTGSSQTGYSTTTTTTCS